MNTKQKGILTEVRILYELVKRGYAVSIPYGDNEKYDLILDTGDGTLYRVQCKTGRYREGCVRFNAYKVTSNTKINKVNFYNKEQIDLFAVFCLELNKIYLVPVDGKQMPYLRVDAPKNNQVKGIRWAKDFELA